MFNINFEENFLLNFYQAFSFAIFHVIDLNLEIILSNDFFLIQFILLYYFHFMVKHQLNAQNTILLKYSRYELKTTISENFRVTRGCTSRDLRRVTDKVSATPVYTMINTHCPLLKSRTCRDVRTKLCNTLLTCALRYVLFIKCSLSIEINV